MSSLKYNTRAPKSAAQLVRCMMPQWHSAAAGRARTSAVHVHSTITQAPHWLKVQPIINCRCRQVCVAAYLHGTAV